MAGILRVRGCKLCGGNILVVRDRDGLHTFCVQCGHVCQEKDAPADGTGSRRELLAEVGHSSQQPAG